MKKVVITDYFKNPNIEKFFLGKNVRIVCLNETNEEKFSSEIENSDAILVWHAKITNKTFKRLKKCKAIIRYGVGYDNIDILEAKRKKIICANTPDYGIDEVADTACALMISLIRKIYIYNLNSKKYKKGWQENVIRENIFNPIKRSNEHKLGIIGLGRIGSAIALRMKPFGIQVGFYDPYLKSGIEKTLRIKKFDNIKDLLKFSSVISINCTLNETTKGMINKSLIKKMNHNTILVNTARGGIIDNLNSLVYGLKIKKIGAIGLDVLPEEPPNKSEKFIKIWKNANHSDHNKIIINPHAAYYSSRSIIEMREKAAENVKRALKDIKINNIVN